MNRETTGNTGKRRTLASGSFDDLDSLGQH